VAEISINRFIKKFGYGFETTAGRKTFGREGTLSGERQEHRQASAVSNFPSAKDFWRKVIVRKRTCGGKENQRGWGSLGKIVEKKEGGGNQNFLRSPKD